MTLIRSALFAPGQMVRHKTYGYRGLIYDVDPMFNQQTAWLEKLDLMEPIGNLPWYHVLVDGEDHASYVSEDNLEAASGLDARMEFNHPLLSSFFDSPDSGMLSARHNIN